MVCRFMISVHPEVEARVLAELRALQLMPSAERPQPRAIKYDDMARLTYTSNAIKALLTPTLYSTAMSAHLPPQTRHLDKEQPIYCPNTQYSLASLGY